MRTATKSPSYSARELIDHAPARSGSDRAFGVVFAVVFSVIAAFPVFTGGEVRWWALALSGAFLLAAIARPALLAPLNRVWMRFGFLLNRIVSPIALLVVFVVAILPTALVLRALRKDPMRRTLDANAVSYWIMRSPPGRPDAQMRKQF